MRTDIELVELIKLGEQEAFNEIVTRYTQKVHQLALRITRNLEDTEEILQDVFVTVYRKVDKFEGKSAFSSWLYRITANTALMKLRKRKQHQASSLDEILPNFKESSERLDSQLIEQDSIEFKHELRQHMEDAVSSLAQDDKLIFILRDIDGLSNEEVGEIVKMSIPAVKSRLHRARLVLRKKLRGIHSAYTAQPNNYSGYASLAA